MAVVSDDVWRTYCPDEDELADAEKPQPKPYDPPGPPVVGWVDYSERKPRKEDADKLGRVMYESPDGILRTERFDVRVWTVDPVRWARNDWLRSIEVVE